MNRWLLVALGAAVMVGTAAPSLAQDEKRDECECAVWSLQLGPRAHARGIRLGSRARLGIWVEMQPDPERDRIGAEVRRVMDGGPADRAGIRAGDIITKLNGVSLAVAGEVDAGDESPPALKLLELARELERGDTVEVEFRRDSKTQTVELVAGEFDDSYLFAPGSVDVDDMGRRVRVLVERLRDLPRIGLTGPEVTYVGPDSWAVRCGAPFPGLQLVALNADLGEYFGTEEGVLVLSVPEQSELGLKAGDVILEIDGRKVNSPGHAMRILRSYDPDEEVSFLVRRKNRNETVRGTVAKGMQRGVIGIRKGDSDEDNN